LSTIDAGLRPQPTVRHLLERLPLSLAWVGPRGEIVYANQRFAQAYATDQGNADGLRGFVADGSAAWQSTTLIGVDGGAVEATVLPVRDDAGCVLVVDERPDRALVEELQARVAALEALSSTDALTGAWNRRHLERTVTLELARSHRRYRPCTLILLDIDHFKGINDGHGHLAGDAVLMEFVQRVAAHIRCSDMLFRWGGEEFVILATDTGYRGGRMLAEKLRSEIECQPFDGVGHVRASLGVAEHIEGERPEAWFQRVDRALYAAKNDGRNCVHVDCRGSSDTWAATQRAPALRLEWQEGYECGEPTIDREHRQLFDLGTALIALAMRREHEPDRFRAALDDLFAHVEWHFHNEEELLARVCYPRLAGHRRSHAGLLTRARELERTVDSGAAGLGDLVDFLVTDVISGHLVRVDRDYFPLFALGGGELHGEPG
jgi:diguanylate cyclase (GGDEF)-like protein/hemerythrin-like metal-binding protein